eukprot:7026373-Pyramimonas_sp.AAC.1
MSSLLEVLCTSYPGDAAQRPSAMNEYITAKKIRPDGSRQDSVNGPSPCSFHEFGKFTRHFVNH